MNKKTTMTDLRILLREFFKGTSLRGITRKTGLSRTSVTAYRDRLKASGTSAEDALRMDDHSISEILCKDCGHRNLDDDKYEELEPMMEGYSKQMRNKYVTYQVIYSDYVSKVKLPYSYTQFKEKIKKYSKNHNYSYHNEFEPGDEMQVDFCGDNLYIIDRKTRIARKAYVLVCVLAYSKLSFAIAMLDTKLASFFDGLSKCLGYFDGVPAVVKSDNMRQWVKKIDRYEPAFTEAAQQWALHYGTSLDSARVRHPRDKAAVESLVNQVYKYYYSRIGSGNGSGRRMEFGSIGELNNYLFELNDQFNDEYVQNLGRSRFEKYENEEKSLMMPLPPAPFTFKYEKTFNVSSTYHVQVDNIRHFYSIPHQYVGKTAKAVFDVNTVEIWIDLQRVAVHRRVLTDGWSTVDEHMPPEHQAYRRSKEHNAAYFIDKAKMIGPETTEVMGALLNSKYFPQQSYKACHGLLSLAGKFSPARLERACSKKQVKSSAKYMVIKNILEHNLDTVANPSSDDEPYIPKNDDVRGSSAYL